MIVRSRSVLVRLILVLGGLLLGIAILVGVELLLRGFGIGDDGPRRDPFAGFSSTVPFFEDAVRSDGTPIRRVARRKADAERPYEPQREFVASPPDDLFRIFVVGGSSAEGVPYSTRYAFSSWLERRLESAIPDQPIEIVNAAMSSYASRRVLRIAREIAHHSPDLLIVMTGHNELAERMYYAHLIDMDPRLFRFWEWIARMRLFAVLSPIGETLGDFRTDAPELTLTPGQNQRQMFAVIRNRAAGADYPTARDLAYRDLLYEYNLNEIARVMAEADCRVLFLGLIQNLSDWPPGASAHRADLSPQETRRWNQLAEQGDELAEAGDCEAALEAYGRALAIDEHFAELHFRVARCLRRLGRRTEALRHYRRASDLDLVPLGAPSHFNKIAQRVAEAHGELFVDPEPALLAASADGLAGDDLFADFVHPRIGTHQLVAKAVADGMREAGLPVESSRWVDRAHIDPRPASLFDREPRLVIEELENSATVCWLTNRRRCFFEKLREIKTLDPDGEFGRYMAASFGDAPVSGLPR